MNGIHPAMIPILVQRDVDLVKKEAKIVINLSTLNLIRNPKPGINLIAIIGPGEFLGRKYREALLCEIGLGRSRSYHDAQRPKDSKLNESRWVEKRRKWFFLNKEEYLVVAPLIFEILQELTDKKVATWKHNFYSDDPFLLPTPRNYFSRHQKKLHQSISMRPQRTGIRFAVSKKDEFLVRDIYWAALNNLDLKIHLNGLAKFIDLYLSPYKKQRPLRRRFSKLKRVVRVKRTCLSLLSKRGAYLLPELLKCLPKGQRNPLWPHLVYLLGYGGSATKERRLADSALPDSKNRVGNLEVKITTGLFGKYGKQGDILIRDHIVFEVLPSYYSHNQAS